MKNEEIHKRYSQSEIRDFLSRELRDSEERGGIGGDYAEKYLEKQIEGMKEILKYVKKTNALRLLVKEMNWEEWGVDNKEIYSSFIGTKEEYKKLMKVLKEENKNE